MTPAFRNVDGDVSNPVGSWPQGALQAAMERGISRTGDASRQRSAVPRGARWPVRSRRS